MSENRVRDYWNAPGSSGSGNCAVATAEAFVPCPVLALATAGPYSFVAEVYRLARERTEAQLRRRTRVFRPAFSLN